MRASDQTAIGGVCGRFSTTEWSVIERIQRGEDPEDRLAGELLEGYWRLVYCYARRKGLDSETAKDLTQSFFQEVVLARDLIHRADHAKGSFRMLLLTALERYLRSQYRRQTACKRHPAGRRIPLDQVDLVDQNELITRLTAEEGSDGAWLTIIMNEVVAEVEKQCRAHGMEIHWQVFHGHVLDPILTDRESPGLAAVGKKYDISDPIKVSNMIVTVNRRLQATLRRHLRQYASTSTMAEEEVTEFLRMFSGKHAG